MKISSLFTSAAASVLIAACTGHTTVPVKPPEKPVLEKPVAKEEGELKKPEEPKEPPPMSAPARPFTAPKVAWAELKNGLKVASRLDRAVPIAHIRIAVQAGSAVDGEKTGLAAVCARAVASSGIGAKKDADVRRNLETLGASLKVDVDPDRVLYGISVSRERLGEAFDLLAGVVARPGLGEKDIERVQREVAEEASDNARDGRWGALMVLYQDLFTLPSEHHPYASYDAMVTDVAKIKPADCKDYHRRFFVPKNMLVAVSGDVKAEEVRAAADKSLGKMSGGAAPTVSFTDPVPPESSKITLVERPGGTQSEIVVGFLGPKQEDAGYPAFLVAEQVLGGAFTGRLFTDVREKRGLAYLTFSNIDTYANGPSVFYAYAQTKNESTGDALEALLEHVRAMTQAAPSAAEVETASRFVAGWRALNAGIPGRSAEEIANLWAARLPDEAPEELARAVRQATPESVGKSFGEVVRPRPIIVVAGDSSEVGPLLQAFGEVKVVDPTRSFARVRTLPSKGNKSSR